MLFHTWVGVKSGIPVRSSLTQRWSGGGALLLLGVGKDESSNSHLAFLILSRGYWDALLQPGEGGCLGSPVGLEGPLEGFEKRCDKTWLQF